jgi:hypothetical protein
MSAVPAVTMQDLELEHAELLPARETLCVGHLYPGPGHPCPGPVHYYPGPVHYYPGPVHYYPGPVRAL